jgi:hypothetical protein
MLPMATYDKNGESKYVNDLLRSLGGSDELEMFSSKIVVDYYEFMWNSFAKHVHYFGAIQNAIMLAVFILYVDQIYLYRRFDYRLYLLYILICCKIYPLFYDYLQLYTKGPSEYFKDPQNYLD